MTYLEARELLQKYRGHPYKISQLRETARHCFGEWRLTHGRMAIDLMEEIDHEYFRPENTAKRKENHLDLYIPAPSPHVTITLNTNIRAYIRDEIEREMVRVILQLTGGNRLRAAAIMGISIRGLRNILAKLKQEDDFRADTHPTP